MVIKKMIVVFIVVSCLCRSEGAIRNLIFEQVSTSNISDIRCALEEYDTSHARGVKFDSGSGSCETLPESWFSNKAFENDKTYHTLLMEEMRFQAGPEIESEMPPSFTSSGSSVVLHIYIGDIDSNLTIGVHVKTKDGTIICYHFYIAFSDKLVVFNTLNGTWGEEVRSVPFTGLFPTSFTTYRFEIRLITAAIELHLNGVLVYTFPNRMPVTVCDTIVYKTTVIDSIFECQRIQYFY